MVYQCGSDMDCVCKHCGAQFSRSDSLARHLRKKIPCKPLQTRKTYTPEPVANTQRKLESTRLGRLEELVEELSNRIDRLDSHKDGYESEEDVVVDGDNTIPPPTRNKSRALCTRNIAKHAKDLSALANASPYYSRRILADAPTTLHQALGDVAQLVLDHKIGVPPEHHDEANEHIEELQEFADAMPHEKREMLQTGGGFLSSLGSILGAVAKPLLSILGI